MYAFNEFPGAKFSGKIDFLYHVIFSIYIYRELYKCNNKNIFQHITKLTVNMDHFMKLD